MRGREDPNKFMYNTGGHHAKRLGWKDPEPTESQVRLVQDICSRLGIQPPKNYTKRAYTQFISNNVRRSGRNGTNGSVQSD